MSTAPAVTTRRCNPYGHETGGPRHLLGGVYGPEYEGALYKWQCERAAEIRCRMTCQCGHKGQVMELCGPGIVIDAQGRPFTHPGHVAELSKRGSDSCPVCMFPPEARELAATAESAQLRLGHLESIGYALSPQARSLRVTLEAAATRLDELNLTGRIHKCPLTITEIS
jgi:hypothetical protein